ncbi:MAG: hypothetical protein ACD_75C01096G0002 [uncultured bacterium]|nr:MAG: hypothetical protein ACD_75C01096G0002 [uncultured bacterium]
MNTKQKVVALATGIILAGMLLFPPFQTDNTESVCYDWAWSRQTQLVDQQEPADVQAYTAEPALSVSRLVIQMAVALIAGAVGVFCLAAPETSYMARFHRMEKEMNRRAH